MDTLLKNLFSLIVITLWLVSGEARGGVEYQATQEKEAMADKDHDPYLWLEDVEGEQALAWAREQNKRSLAELKDDTRFDGFHQSAMEIYNSNDRIAAPSIVGDRVRNFWQDEAHVRGVWREASLESYVAGTPDWQTILDVDALAEEESENWVWEGSNCLAPDNDRCIVTLSRGGSDAAVRREFIISERKFVEDGFYLPEMKGAIAWLDKDKVMVAGDVADDGLTSSGYPRVVRIWTRGTGLEQSTKIFEGNAEDVGIWPAAIIRDGKTFAWVTKSLTFFEKEYFEVDLTLSKVFPMTSVPRRASIEGYVAGKIMISLQQDWNAKYSLLNDGSVAARAQKTRKSYRSGDLVAARFNEGNLTGLELVFSPSSTQAVQSVAIGLDAVYVQLLDNIVGKVKRFQRTPEKWVGEDVPLPGDGDISLGSVNNAGNDFFLYFDSPTDPSTLYYINDDAERARIKQSPSFYDTNGVVMRQYQAVSNDGTKVPYFVIGREAVMEAGNAPVIQYGYGGFEIPVTPGYSGIVGKLWLENNGLYVIANIRGGGEFGPRWHQAALKENRQRAYDDFFAVSEDLIERGLTTSEKLGAIGGSNGGLLMGVALTQRPDLYNALAIGVPLLDMKRYHKLLAGASWVGEYGNPEIPEEWDYIRKYSPYQNVQKDAEYPRVYFFTSTKDDRVHPGHARKMAAKMADYGHPFLYYENIEGGHGAAANLKQAAFRQALQYVYFSKLLTDKQD